MRVNAAALALFCASYVKEAHLDKGLLLLTWCLFVGLLRGAAVRVLIVFRGGSGVVGISWVIIEQANNAMPG